MLDKNLLLSLLAVDGGVDDATPTDVVGNEGDVVDNSVDNVDNSQPNNIEGELPNTPNDFEIDGERYTIDQIKEWKTGNLRQSDYLANVERIKQMEEQHKDAIELFEYLRNKPELAKKLYEMDTDVPKEKIDKLNPYDSKIAELETKFRTMEIESELNAILAKDKDVTDMDLLKIANENKCSINLAYNIWKGVNADKIIQKKLAEQSKQITQNIQKNNGVTKTIITEGDKSNDKSSSFGLTDIELAFSKKLGMTPEEYSKWKA